MACLGWLMNLGFAGSPIAAPAFIGEVNFTITSFVLPRVNLWDYVYATAAIDNALQREVVLNVKFVNGVALVGDMV